MKKVMVDLVKNSYPIYICEEFATSLELLSTHIKDKQVFIITDEHVAPLYLASLSQKLINFTCEHVILPAGEQFKTLESFNNIITELLQKHLDRTVTLIALGGGVIGDLTGFVAACYRRGVNFIQMPTTLLAQVDASIGGKTAVNHPLGKNMIGAFHQPKCVFISVTALKTLPEREFIAGLAEVVKYGLIADEAFFSWIEINYSKILERDLNTLMYMIARSCQIKADFVAKDEFELSSRALLNLGHTFGHAIETATEYKEWLHGEAVAMGIVLAADLSYKEGWLNQQDYSRIKNILQKLGLPLTPPPIMTEALFLNIMAQDKKVLAGQLRLVLLKKIGCAVVTNDFTMEKLQKTLLQATSS